MVLSANLILLVAFILVLLILILLGVRVVPQGRKDVIERLGRYTRTLEPGLNLIIPFVDSRRARVNVQERVLDIPPQVVITADNVSIKIDGAIFIQAVDPRRAVYEVDDLNLAVQTLAQTNLRATVGAMELDSALSKRDEINARILEAIQRTADGWGTVVTRVEVADLEPPASILESMAQQLEADRRKRAAILDAEGIKQSEILRAEGDKQAQILKAEGERDAQIAVAEGEAKARELTAEAEKKALELINAGAGTGQAALTYLVAQAHVDAVKSVAGSEGSNTLVLPTELSGVAGALSALKAIGGKAPEDGDGTAPPAKGPWG